MSDSDFFPYLRHAWVDLKIRDQKKDSDSRTANSHGAPRIVTVHVCTETAKNKARWCFSVAQAGPRRCWRRPGCVSRASGRAVPEPLGLRLMVGCFLSQVTWSSPPPSRWVEGRGNLKRRGQEEREEEEDIWKEFPGPFHLQCRYTL